MNAGLSPPIFAALAVALVLLCTVPVAGVENGGQTSSATVQVTGTVPLVIYDLGVTGICRHAAVVSWKTNGEADSHLFIDTVAHDDISEYRYQIGNDEPVSDHRICIGCLASGTTYHVRVSSEMSGLPPAVSEDIAFTTKRGGCGWMWRWMWGDGGEWW